MQRLAGQGDEMLMGQDAKELPQVDETYDSLEDECSRQLERSPCKEQ